MLDPLTALRVLEDARRAGCVVLGIDGLRTGVDFTHPDLGESVDYSSMKPLPENTIDLAIAFINERLSSDLVFELVLADGRPRESEDW